MESNDLLFLSTDTLPVGKSHHFSTTESFGLGADALMLVAL